jgi:L-lactate dehydrogenase complex protein LldF
VAVGLKCPVWELVFLKLLARSATGQKSSTYVSLIQGPRRPGELDGPEEMHIILLDNGRSRFRQDDEMRPSLYCLRCGACLNVCPVFHGSRSLMAGLRDPSGPW